MRIGILTSGGDAPGMNAAIRAATLVGRSQGADVVGIERGYRGLLEDAVIPLLPSDVAGNVAVRALLAGTSHKMAAWMPPVELPPDAGVRSPSDPYAGWSISAPRSRKLTTYYKARPHWRAGAPVPSQRSRTHYCCDVRRGRPNTARELAGARGDHEPRGVARAREETMRL